MIQYPNINPIAFSLGPIQVHWYGLMYLFGFILAWGLAHYRARHYQRDWTAAQIEDLIFYAALGVILGGRLGYMLFYTHGLWYKSPMSIFHIWEGGMSFHGGLIGVVVALAFFAKKIKRSFWEVADFTAPLVPLAIALGRWGNFINGELWGRPTTLPWGMVFPYTEGLPRHPSQLYELGLEGLLLFILVWFYARRPHPPGRVAGVFLLGYAACRMLAECFRQPDPQLGFLAFNWLTMGQLLSVPLALFGLYLFWRKA